MINWMRNPHNRVVFAWVLFAITLIAWPTTHFLMVLTDPPENSWVFHVLLAISWWAITFTAVDIIATADVRKEQEENNEN